MTASKSPQGPIARSWWWQAPTTPRSQGKLLQGSLQEEVTISLAIISCEEEAISMSREWLMWDPMGQLPCEERQAVGCQCGVVSWSAPVIKAAEWWQETARTKNSVSGVGKRQQPSKRAVQSFLGIHAALSSAQLNCSQGLSAPHVLQSQTSDFGATTWNGEKGSWESRDLTH